MRLTQVATFKEVQELVTLQDRLKLFIPNNIASIRKIAEGLGYSPYTVKNWIRDPRALKSTATVIRIAQYLEIDIGLLLDGILIGKTLTYAQNILPLEIVWEVAETNEFILRVLILRDHLKITSQSFRDSTSYSRNRINRIYERNYPPHLESLARISNCLYVPPSVLLRGIAYVDFYDNLIEEL